MGAQRARFPLHRLLAVIALAAAMLRTPASAGDDGARPLPVGKTAQLPEGPAVYYVEGRQRIPKGVELTVPRDNRIVGRGDGATLEVEGKLILRGIGTHEVEVENLVIEPQSTFQGIAMNLVYVRKGGVQTPADRPAAGRCTMELVDFLDGAKLDLSLASGSIELSYMCADTPVRLKGFDAPGKGENAVAVEVRGCKLEAPYHCPHKARVGLKGGLTIESVDDVVVRDSRLGGDQVAVRDWRKRLLFDGNRVDAVRLEFTNPAAGRFQKAQFLKCDLYGTTALFQAPPKQAKETENANVERWHFGGRKASEEGIRPAIRDGAAQPEKNGVRARLIKPAERPSELGGPPPKQ